MENQNKRMLDLIKSFDKKDEVVSERVTNSDQDKKITEELLRLKDLAAGKSNDFFKNEEFQSNYYNRASYRTPGGKSVSSIADDYYKDPVTQMKTARMPLQPEEALEVAIKRTLKSGAPVNNISFYDEVNWNLMNLGFAAKQPIDIKNAISIILEK